METRGACNEALGNGGDGPWDQYCMEGRHPYFLFLLLLFLCTAFTELILMCSLHIRNRDACGRISRSRFKLGRLTAWALLLRLGNAGRWFMIPRRQVSWAGMRSRLMCERETERGGAKSKRIACMDRSVISNVVYDGLSRVYVWLWGIPVECLKTSPPSPDGDHV